MGNTTNDLHLVFAEELLMGKLEVIECLTRPQSRKRPSENEVRIHSPYLEFGVENIIVGYFSPFSINQWLEVKIVNFIASY